ncbi:MAG: family 20 glycosylhydrolase [Ignavibacteriaceae bacterium]|nr:family 20 glycosylhydrolase [Ignavibacteriaceae bacterium]
MKQLKNFIAAIAAVLFLSVFINAEGNDKKLDLMPQPLKVELTGGEFRLDKNFKVEIKGNSAERINGAASRMLRRLSGRTGLFLQQDYVYKGAVVESPSMIININHPGIVKLFEDESYTLTVTNNQVQLSAANDIGAIRGIETFLQLLQSDNSGYYIPDVKIEDSPRFPWRGLMIDVSRHFMPVDVIKRNLDGMVAVKLNVFHWHLSDNQGFRVECKAFPKLTELGSDGLFYTQAQIKDVLKYAEDRGIRVIPEFDIPGHSTSWLVAYPEFSSQSKESRAKDPENKIERAWGVFNPVFDPTNEATYKFFDKFFKEMSELFPDEYMHIGGDENNGEDWGGNKSIQKFMKSHNLKSTEQLQTYFNQKILQILTKYHKKMIGWDEIFQPDLPHDIVIQSWRGQASLFDAARKGYMGLLSNGYYIDLCQPTSFHYLNDPLPADSALDEKSAKNVLGGEATMWAEMITPETIDSRIWPRTAAIAERFWSQGSVKDVRDMYRRMDKISLQLEELGLTHIKNQDMMMRRLVNSDDIDALATLINLVEPVQGYKRGALNPFRSYSPYTRAADISVPDPKAARNFGFLVDDFIAGNTQDLNKLDKIAQELTSWKNNYESLQVLIDKFQSLKDIEPVSKDLYNISVIGLKALDNIKNKTKADSDWVSKSLETIKQARATKAEVELVIISPVEKLVKQAGGK